MYRHRWLRVKHLFLYELLSGRFPFVVVTVIADCNCGMARTRLSTTVDRDLLDGARRAYGGTTDAELIDEALAALLSRYRAAELDAAYDAAHRAHPIDEADEWGDLASFRDAAAAT